MVLSTSQQVALAFTAVLFTFLVLPRFFGGAGGKQESRFDSRHARKAAGPGAVRAQPVSGSAQSPENMQTMKKLMEQEMKSDKFKTTSNKGYVFTLMPLYAIGVGVFAAYKFLKIKSADEQVQKDKFAKGAKKSAEAENQLNELEQRLAQTERMLNSILTQLDPLTNCVKSVALDQKNEIMSQLQTIRYLMKKRGMDCPPLNLNEASCGRNLDELIESLGANDTSGAGDPPSEEQAAVDTADSSEKVFQKHLEGDDDTAIGDDRMNETKPEDREAEEGEKTDEEEGLEDSELMCSLGESELMCSPEDACETNSEDVGVEQIATGLRRRNRPE